MKRNYKLVVILCTLLSSLFLFACGKSNGIVGKWVYTSPSGSEQAFTFKSNGNIELDTALGSATGTYEVEGDTITYTLEMPNGESKTTSVNYKNNGDSLDITISGTTYRYVKQ